MVCSKKVSYRRDENEKLSVEKNDDPGPNDKFILCDVVFSSNETT
jgi:hypothetical protein